MNILSAEALPFYIGTYSTNSASDGIYLAYLETKSGEISKPLLVAEVDDPEYLALSPDGSMLYAATNGRDGGFVTAYRVEDDLSLKKLNRVSLDGNRSCHISLDGEGRHLFSASYGKGTASVIGIKEDGSVSEVLDLVQFEGSGPNERRQKQPHAHAIYASPQHRYVYVCDLGTDKVWSFALDAESGKLTALDPAAGEVPPGGGPRHLAFHPNGKFAYVNNEMGLGVTVFSMDHGSGQLSPVQTISTLAEGTGPEGLTTAAIRVHPNGKWLYVSSRGDDTVAAFEIADDGTLTAIGNVPAGVEQPREMQLDPTGQWVITAGQKDDQLAALRINSQTGELKSARPTQKVGSPVSIVFAK
ncbi:lactonase family protein [Rubellicoccus peritrichatus]|uniref:Lactonase family protein n=1 Tax=Rubellicoccus peritrichatus TaxID=3080537 RepID=A0AAQ3QW90_9BACT|nr:lactonase family protein [Puniceicoccus sp. CR14]WOO42423.1 lactonase family protein [Puniceicoccus sp. CR14]